MKTVVSAANSNNSSTTSAIVASNTVVPKTEPVTSEDGMQFQTPNTTSTPNNNSNINKRPMSLDLDLNKPAAKKRSLITPLLIDSPDLQSMNKTLNTPDLEKILLSSNMLQTPQPGTVFPAKVGPITSEQEAFGKGFEEALHSLHTSKNSQALINNNTSSTSATNTTATTSMTAINTGMSGGSFTYTNMENFPVIKDEPQNVNTSPPVSPIDMETQEKIKLERKRQRNRVAASKCRKRKLERITKLEDKVKILKGENTDLAMIVKNLKDHVAQLKQHVMEHMDAGCNVNPITNGGIMQGK